MKWVVEPGDFVLMAGASSEDIRLNGTLTVEDYQTRAKAIEAQKPAKRVSASTNPEDAENVLDEKTIPHGKEIREIIFLCLKERSQGR